MKQQVSPGVLAGIVALAVIGLIFWGYRAMQPAPYLASPGVNGVPAVGVSGMPGQSKPAYSAKQGGREYVLPPKGSIPGMPTGYSTKQQDTAQANPTH